MVMSKMPVKLVDTETGKMMVSSQNLAKRHGGVLGLCSYINAHPYDIPVFLPTVISFLCKLVNESDPISVSLNNKQKYSII
jgi:hypothetical protein